MNASIVSRVHHTTVFPACYEYNQFQQLVGHADMNMQQLIYYALEAKCSSSDLPSHNNVQGW